MAPPPRFNKAVADRICNFIRGGALPETAVAAAGVSRNTFYRWLRQGNEEGKGPKHEFVLAIERCLGECDAIWTVRMDKHSEEHWQALAWLMERRFKHWRVDRRVELTGAGGAPLSTFPSFLEPYRNDPGVLDFYAKHGRLPDPDERRRLPAAERSARGPGDVTDAEPDDEA